LPQASHEDSRKKHIKPIRQKWFGCACCPPNLARLISSIGEYCYTQNDDTLFIHQYIGSEVNCDNAQLSINSTYMLDGKVKIKVNPNKAFTLAIRIPSHCKSFKISAQYEIKNGYAYINIDDVAEIDVEFEISAQLIKCSNHVRANIGKVAVMRGAVVYCLEGKDNGADLQMLRISEQPNFEYDGENIIADGYREYPDESLYSEYSQAPAEPCKLTFIPYYRWGNRGENEMTVYVRI
jgi:hypothetical protein